MENVSFLYLIHPAFHCAGVLSISPEHYLILDRLPDMWNGWKWAGSSHWKLCCPLPEKNIPARIVVVVLLECRNPFEGSIIKVKWCKYWTKVVQHVGLSFYKGIKVWENWSIAQLVGKCWSFSLVCRNLDRRITSQILLLHQYTVRQWMLSLTFEFVPVATRLMSHHTHLAGVHQSKKVPLPPEKMES